MVSFPQVSPPEPCAHLSPPHTCHMPCPSHSSLFYHPLPDITINVIRSSCRVPVVLWDFCDTEIFSLRVFEKFYLAFHENSSDGSRTVPCGEKRRTDIQTWRRRWPLFIILQKRPRLQKLYYKVQRKLLANTGWYHRRSSTELPCEDLQIQNGVYNQEMRDKSTLNSKRGKGNTAQK